MKRKFIAGVIGVFLSMGLLAGCAKTPDNSLIKQKGDASLKNYEEGESLGAAKTEESDAAADENDEGGSGISGENSTVGNTALSENSVGVASGGTSTDESGLPKAVSGENKLRAALNAPEHYQSESKDETGKLQLLIDAEVEIPNTSKVSAVSVSQHSFNQEYVDKITNIFFPDTVFYSSDSYYQATKADYQKKIELLKGYVAEGNMDPYNYGKDEDGNLVYDIYQRIEDIEKEYQKAPETRQLEEVHPKLTKESGNSSEVFQGIACPEDGKRFLYQLSFYPGMPMNIKIHRMDQDEKEDQYVTSNWGEYDYDALKSYDPELASKYPDEEKIKEELGIGYEEAKALADEKVAALGIPSMEINCWDYAVKTMNQDDEVPSYTDVGYLFHYTRNINNIPVTYTNNAGGAFEGMYDEVETWGYEWLDVTVTRDGIDTVDFRNLYDLGEVKTENLNLLPFDEVMRIFEKMKLIQNADVLEHENCRTYHIDRITLGYARIYEPSSNSKVGVLIPVWDFFGSFDTEYEIDGQRFSDTTDEKYTSYMTINAIDGSIIDRELGY